MFCIRRFIYPRQPTCLRPAAPWIRDRPVRSTQNDCDMLAV